MTAPSTRLTNHMRETIVNRVIEDRFGTNQLNAQLRLPKAA